MWPKSFFSQKICIQTPDKIQSNVWKQNWIRFQINLFGILILFYRVEYFGVSFYCLFTVASYTYRMSSLCDSSNLLLYYILSLRLWFSLVITFRIISSPWAAIKPGKICFCIPYTGENMFLYSSKLGGLFSYWQFPSSFGARSNLVSF